MGGYFYSVLVRLPSDVAELQSKSISGLVVEYVVAIDVTRVRFPADAARCVIVVARVRSILDFNVREHQWFSGRIRRCHRRDPGSIPG